MISSLSGGFYFLVKGLRLITRPGLRRFVLLPLFINVLIFSGALWLGVYWFDQFMQWILPSWLGFLEYILWPLFALSFLVVGFYSFSLIINVIAAPFNGLLAEQTEKLLRGEQTEFTDASLKALIRTAPAMIWNELVKLFYFLLRAIPLLILFLIPGLNLLAPLLWFIFSAWMLSLEYLDYPMGNHSILFKQAREQAREKRSLCLGFGSGATLLTMIPIANFIAMPVAVCGATSLWVEKFESNSAP